MVCRHQQLQTDFGDSTEKRKKQAGKEGNRISTAFVLRSVDVSERMGRAAFLKTQRTHFNLRRPFHQNSTTHISTHTHDFTMTSDNPIRVRSIDSSSNQSSFAFSFRFQGRVLSSAKGSSVLLLLFDRAAPITTRSSFHKQHGGPLTAAAAAQHQTQTL